MFKKKQGRHNLFLTPLLFVGLSVRIFGDIYLTEIIFSVYAVNSIISGHKVFKAPSLNKIPLLLFFWTVANLISSINAGKNFSVILIAVGTVLIFGLTLRTVIDFFSAHPDQILNAFIFFILGRIIGLFFNPLPYTDEYPWKFGFGEWIVLFLLVIVAKYGLTRLLLLGLPLLTFVSLANQARTIAFLCVGVLLIFIFSNRKQIGLGRLVILILIPVLAYNLYLAIALNGSLGITELKRAQSLSNNELGPLVARKEIVFSSRAFAASPIIGYGFQPQVSTKILNAGQQQLAAKGVFVSLDYLENFPLHSFLMSALVQGGIFAGFFWIFALFKSIRFAIVSFELNRFLSPLSAYLALSLIDRILFSPFGAFERLNVCFFLGFILTFKQSRNLHA